ncbi:MAG: HlyD family efflux transporter periplasmic adaptor subunit [Verrucomicrobiae bacterium]
MRKKTSPLFLASFFLSAAFGHCADPLLVSQPAPATVLVLRAREPGYLDELLVERGEKVARGQIMARLDSWRQIYSVEVAKRRLDNRNGVLMAEADLREKEAARDEASSKFKRRLITEAQLVAVVTQFEMSQCRVALALDALEQAQLDLALAERALEERFVKSPFTGRVVDLLRTLGERTIVGDAILSVGDDSKLRAELPFSKEAASKLAAAGFLMVKTSPHGTPIKALIESISPVPNSSSGEKSVRLIFDNPEAKPDDSPEENFPAANQIPPSPTPAIGPPGKK